jgi:hypothetical protein
VPSLEELRQRVQIIEGDEAVGLHRRFIGRFVDTKSTYYLERIATRICSRMDCFRLGIFGSV